MIIVGGTGQYISALLEGWNVPNVPPDFHLRKELEEQARIDGPEALLEELRSLDPNAAEMVDHKNARRIIRAIYLLRFKTVACAALVFVEIFVCIFGSGVYLD